ncbi:MAG: V-type ATP synthase subunit I [Bacillota bacterium]
MAIVKMNKLSLIGLETDKERILESLMKMGVVEIIDSSEKISSEEWTDLVVADGDSEGVSHFDENITRVKAALEYLSKFDKRKKGMFNFKRSVNVSEYKMVIQNLDKLWSVVNQIIQYDEQLSNLKSEKNKNTNLIISLDPWKSLTVPLELSSTRTTSVLLGVIPEIADTEKLKQDMSEQVPESYIEVVNEDKDQSYLLVVYYSAREEDAMKILKQHGFSKVTFKDLEGTAANNISAASKAIEEIEKNMEEVENKIASFVNFKDDLEILHDHLVTERDRKKILDNMVKTNRVFMLEGWVPANISEKVRKRLNEISECVVDIHPPGPDEEYPVLLKNSTLVQPYEMITEMYSLPSSKGLDPSVFMTPFYFVFFGLMVSDAGYGLLMALITGILLLKYKFEGLLSKLMRLIFFGGISTFIWGVLFGGWFGNILDLITGSKDPVIPALWFNPLNDPMRLLIWSIIFGAIHLSTGMALKAYMLIKDGKPWDALFDIGFWYIFLIGLPMLAAGGIIGTIGKYMAIVGAVLLVLTQGRGQKGIVKKLLSGVLSLYNVTGYLSDLLSYSRLLALGLATGVIATVINTVGTLFGFNILGIIILAVIFIVGHVFNILINALGAYVHSSRLQYVEFFSKFYEGGGKDFQPFKRNTKYININDKEAI